MREWLEIRSAELPGPGEYDVPTGLNTRGGTWSMFKPKTDVELAMLRAEKIPGPGDYGNPARPGSCSGVRFNEYKPKSDLDWAIFRANEIPAPGHSQPSTKRVVKNIPQLKKKFGNVMKKTSAHVKKSRF